MKEDTLNTQTKLSLAIVLLVAVAVVLQLSGCSLIGFGIGSVIDSAGPDSVLIPGWKVKTIKPGEEIIVILKDGQKIEGTYEGMEPVPKVEYAKRYASFRKQKSEEFSLPALGDTITIELKSGVRGQREFFGFDHQYLSAKLEEEKDSTLIYTSYMVSVRQLGDTTSGMVFLNKIEKIIDTHGNVVDGEALQELAFEGQIPLLSEIVLGPRVGINSVAMEKVYQIQVPKRGNAKWTCLGIGAAIDVIVIIVALASGDDSEPKQTTPDTGMCGCPFVYSYDGEEFILDSEAFGGSIFEAAKRYDWSKLGHLRETKGVCKIKITDELQETDYIDEVKLLVVEHPKDVEVLPSFAGKLHVLSESYAPLSVADYQGNPVLEQVKAKDEKFWLSNPFGRDPEIKSQARDGLILEFHRPVNATFVKMAFNLKNTIWAAHLQAKFLELHGSDLESWYELMNNSPEAREAFQRAFIREGMLSIKLWNGENWETAGFIWEVGANVFRDQVVWLDIENIPGEILKLKLESTAGLWMINSVQADYRPDLILDVIEVSVFDAKDHLGTDLQQMLQTTDNNYYVMDTGDWAELIFRVPPQKKEYQRSYILKTSGFYTINVNADGQPNPELVTRFITEPAAFGQFTLRLLNGYVLSALEQLK
jgi:hypothetical protein